MLMTNPTYNFDSCPPSSPLSIWGPIKFLPPPILQKPCETVSYSQFLIDWKETPTAHIFKADVPGMKKDEVVVEVENGHVLQLSGERTREKEEYWSDTWHRIERSCGRFSRRFWLPANARVGDIKASMEDGVLTVTVPKQEFKMTSVRSIQISG